MNDQQLINNLNSIGKSCFVSHYEIFRDYSRSDPSFAIDYLLKNMKIKESGARIRVSFAKGIFNAGRQTDALRIIANSNRIDPELLDKARRLLGNAAAT